MIIIIPPKVGSWEDVGAFLVTFEHHMYQWVRLQISKSFLYCWPLSMRSYSLLILHYVRIFPIANHDCIDSAQRYLSCELGGCHNFLRTGKGSPPMVLRMQMTNLSPIQHIHQSYHINKEMRIQPLLRMDLLSSTPKLKVNKGFQVFHKLERNIFVLMSTTHQILLQLKGQN